MQSTTLDTLLNRMNRYNPPIKGMRSGVNNPMFGRKHSKETKSKMAVSNTGNKANLGRKFTVKHKQRIAKSLTGRKHLGMEKNPMWKGGKSFEEYPREFNRELKNAVKSRDGHKCMVCEGNNRLQVHHIDYNKRNCVIENLVTLCVSCHTKTNHNRERWMAYFK